jgi:hypothetical protein
MMTVIFLITKIRKRFQVIKKSNNIIKLKCKQSILMVAKGLEWR